MSLRFARGMIRCLKPHGGLSALLCLLVSLIAPISHALLAQGAESLELESLISRALDRDRYWNDPPLCAHGFYAGRLDATVVEVGREAIVMLPALGCGVRIRSAMGQWRVLVISQLEPEQREGTLLKNSLPPGESGVVTTRSVSLNLRRFSPASCVRDEPSESMLLEAVRSFLRSNRAADKQKSSGNQLWLPPVCRVDARVLVAIYFADATSLVDRFSHFFTILWRKSVYFQLKGFADFA